MAIFIRNYNFNKYFFFFIHNTPHGYVGPRDSQNTNFKMLIYHIVTSNIVVTFDGFEGSTLDLCGLTFAPSLLSLFGFLRW